MKLDLKILLIQRRMGTWNVNGGQNRRMYLNWKEDNFVQILTISLTLNWNAKLPNLSDTQ